MWIISTQGDVSITCGGKIKFYLGFTISAKCFYRDLESLWQVARFEWLMTPNKCSWGLKRMEIYAKVSLMLKSRKEFKSIWIYEWIWKCDCTSRKNNVYLWDSRVNKIYYKIKDGKNLSYLWYINIIIAIIYYSTYYIMLIQGIL